MAKPKGPKVDMDWRGDQVLTRQENAARRGIDEVMKRCVPDAHDNVPVATRALRGSIQIWEEARKDSWNEIAGLWGSADIFYARAVETGDREYLEDMPKRETTKDMKRVPTTENKGNQNFLRGAADKFYPGLAREIRDQLQGLV